jgi:ribosomal protein L7/L12
MTDEEARELAMSGHNAGMSLDEVIESFRGRHCSVIRMMKAVRDVYGVSLDDARDALESLAPTLDGFG